MKYALVVWMGCALIWAQESAPSSRQIVMDIFDNQVKVEKVAIPDFQVSAGALDFKQAGATITDVIGKDLLNSGFFELVDLKRFSNLRNPHFGPIDFEEWASVEAEHLLVGNVKAQDGQMRVEVRLYEIATQKHILAKAYRGKPSLSRKMAHVISDDIMYRLRNIKFATSKIIFARDTPTKDPLRSNKELFIMDYDGQGPLPITKGGTSFSPSAVRIGRDTRLAYCVFEREGTFNANYGLYYKPTLLSAPRPLFADAERRTSSPAISPDGKRIVFHMAEEGNVDLYSVNLDGSDLLKLTSHPSVDTNPSWSPGGNAIMFTSDRTGSPQVYQMDADGLNTRRLTTENPYNDSAVWNPVHNYIAYVSRFDNDFDIFVMNMQTRSNYRVTFNAGSNERPCWSPDGNQLCFTSNRTGSWQLYVVNINGKNLRQITFSGINRSPVWVKGE